MPSPSEEVAGAEMGLRVYQSLSVVSHVSPCCVWLRIDKTVSCMSLGTSQYNPVVTGLGSGATLSVG